MGNGLGFTLTTEERISRGKIQLYTKAPFFSYLIEHMKMYAWEEKDKVGCKTMAVNNKNEMFFWPEFVDGLTDDQLQGVMCHEVMHLALGHTWRGKGREIVLRGSDGSMISLWNLAIDIVVNAIILKNGFALPSMAIIPNIDGDTVEMLGKTIVDIANKSAEEIYDELKQEVKQQLDKQKGSGAKGKGEKGSGVLDYSGELGFDEHNFDEKEGEEGKGKAEEEGAGKDWGQIMSDAATYSKQRGVDPAGLGRDYDILGKSQINWRAILRREIAKSIPVDYTWARPNRRFMSQGIYLPATTSEEVKVLFSVDLSGSVSREECSMYMAEIIAIGDCFPAVEMRVITHDSEVHDDYHVTGSTKNKLKSLELHGGGGTDMVCVHEYIHAKGYDKGYSILVHLTDGYGSFPDKAAVPSYIVLSENHCPKETLPRWSKGNIPLHR